MANINKPVATIAKLAVTAAHVVDINANQPAAKPKGDATAEEAKPAPAHAPAPEPTSEKLTELKSKKKELYEKEVKAEYDSKEWLDLRLEGFKISEQIKAEIANIKKAESEAELQVKRNERIALLDNVLDLHTQVVNSIGNQGMSLEEKNAVNDQFQKAREVVVNELLAKYAGAKPAAPSTNGSTTTGTRGATTAAIRALIAPMYANGISGAEVRKSIIGEHGFNDGTANAVILAYEKELGLKS